MGGSGRKDSSEYGLDAVGCVMEVGVVVQDPGSYLDTWNALSGCSCSKENGF